MPTAIRCIVTLSVSQSTHLQHVNMLPSIIAASFQGVCTEALVDGLIQFVAESSLFIIFLLFVFIMLTGCSGGSSKS